MASDFRYRLTWFWEGEERSSLDFVTAEEVDEMVKGEEKEGFQLRVLDLQSGRTLYESVGLESVKSDA